jgi:hypothetical protein
MRKYIRRGFTAIAVLLTLLLVASVALPYFFSDKIVAKLKTEVNKNLNAKVDFDNRIGISLFRSFPNLSVRLKKLEVVGINEFNGLKLVSADNVDVTLDLLKTIKGTMPYDIKGFSLTRPNIYVKILPNGKANYDISKPSPTTSTSASSPYAIKIRKYNIYDGSIVYDDELGRSKLEIVGLNHSGQGDFTEKIFDLATQTRIESLSYASGGLAYLSKAKADIDLTLHVNVAENKYSIAKNSVKINDLQLDTKGFVKLNDKDTYLDLTFTAPQTDFKALLSMIPGAYSKDFDGVKASGTMMFNGNVKGSYTEKTLPSFAFHIKADNGSFKYPDLPMQVNQITLQAHVNSPTSNLDNMVVDVPSFHLNLDNNPFDAAFNLRTPVSDPAVKAKVNGTIDLAKLSKAFPMEGVKQLTGIIQSDVSVDARASAIEQKQYDQVNMSGSMNLTGLKYAAQDMPEVVLNTVKATFTPQSVQIAEFDSKLGKSDLSMSGSIDNILAYFGTTKTMTGNINLQSNYFNADEWMSAEPENTATAEYKPAAATTPSTPFDRFNFNLNASFGKLKYTPYEINDLKAAGNVTSQAISFSTCSGRIGATDFAVSGKLDNLFSYLYHQGLLHADIAFKSNYLDADYLMKLGETPASTATTKTTTQPTTTTETPLDRLQINLDAQVGKVKYETYNISNIQAKGLINAQTAQINDGSVNYEGSQFGFGCKLDNLANYVFNNQTLKGNIDLKGGYIDLIKLSGTSTTPAATTAAAPTPTEAVAVPANLDVVINAAIDKLQYTNIDLSNMRGKIVVKDQKATLEQCTANGLGGTMNLRGSYDSKNTKKPAFDLAYNLQKLNIQESFKQLNTVKAIAPVAEFIEGLFSSDLKLSGTMNPDMSPDLNTLTGDGFATTFQTIVRNLKPLNAIASQLKLTDFSEVKLSDTKNFFKLSNGKVIFEPTDMKFNDVLVNIGGSHALTQENINYLIKLKIPREKIGKSAAGAVLNSGLDFVNNEASKLGLNVANSAVLNFEVNLTGSLKNPKVGVKLVGGEGKSAQQAVTEQATEQLQGKVDEVKNQLEDKAQTAIDNATDKVQTTINQQVDKVVDKAKEQVGNVVKDKVGDVVKDKVDDVVKDKVGTQVKDKVDDIKDKIKLPWDKKKDPNKK